jgi:hypothetical protein
MIEFKVLYASLIFVQVTSHDASKLFIEKVKADDKKFSSYPVSGPFHPVTLSHSADLGRVPRTRQ